MQAMNLFEELYSPLTDDNFLLYAAKNYQNPQCHSLDEFKEDVYRIKYIKKLLTRYLESGDLKERLILNHFLILNNVFDTTCLIRIIFLKMNNFLPQVKPFLILLNILPDNVYNVKKLGVINTEEIQLDPGICAALRNL
jgi:hypothetical protein